MEAPGFRLLKGLPVNDLRGNMLQRYYRFKGMAASRYISGTSERVRGGPAGYLGPPTAAPGLPRVWDSRGRACIGNQNPLMVCFVLDCGDEKRPQKGRLAARQRHLQGWGQEGRRHGV